jgi:hypothetical protein
MCTLISTLLLSTSLISTSIVPVLPVQPVGWIMLHSSPALVPLFVSAQMHHGHPEHMFAALVL